MVYIESGWIFTKKGTCFDDDFKNRYVLTARNMKLTSKSILITFLMNPSHAGKQENCERFSSITSDDTINLLLRTIGKSYGTVIVFNNIPLIEPNSNNIKSNDCDSFNRNTEKIKSIIQDKSYDLYVGTGIKGSGFYYENNTKNKKNRKTNTFVRESYLKNINMLCNHTKCNNIYTSGLNKEGIPQHPKPYRSPDDITEFLLNSKRKTKWNSKACKLERI